MNQTSKARVREPAGAELRPDVLAEGRAAAIRRPITDDSREFVRLVHASRRLYRGLASPPSTEQQFVALVDRNSDAANFTVLVTERCSGAIVGYAALSQIALGNFRNAYLGYVGSIPFAGRGLITEGVALLVQHAFRRLALHRIEANIQPGNEPSIAIARALGFRLEGFSPRYLKIRGRWRDHERWAITSEDWPGFAAWTRKRRALEKSR
mgnify:FL=1